MISLLAQSEIPDQAHRFLTEDKYTITGVLIVSSIVAILAVWRFSSWIGKEIILPVRDKGFKHLDQVNETMQDISNSLNQMSSIPQRLDRIELKVDDLGNKVENLDTHMKIQDSKIDSLSKGH